MNVRADFLAKKVSEGGGVVYWDNSGEFDRDVVVNSLQPLGLDKLVPRVRSDQAALECGLKKLRSGPDYLVEPRQDKKVNGTELLHLSRGNGHRNLFRLIGAFKAEAGVVQVVERGEIYSSAEMDLFTQQLQQRFDQAKKTLPATSIGTTLIRIAKQLKGACMRNHGGLYWIPPVSVETWKQAVQAIDQAGDATVYFVDTHLTGDSVVALKDALAREVNQTIHELEIELTGSGELDREGRVAKAETLCKKISLYSEVLGESLEFLEAKLKKAAKVEALATLQSVA